MQFLQNLSEILKNIKDLGFGASLGASLLGIIYLAVGLAIPSFYSLDYLAGVLSIGALLGSAVEQRLALTNSNENILNEAETRRQIAKEDIKLIHEFNELGYIEREQVLKRTDQILDKWLLPTSEKQLPKILDSEEQRQIPPSQEEE